MYYLGWQTLGIIGIVDASECIPTFGAGTANNEFPIIVYYKMLIFDLQNFHEA